MTHLLVWITENCKEPACSECLQTPLNFQRNKRPTVFFVSRKLRSGDGILLMGLEALVIGLLLYQSSSFETFELREFNIDSISL